MTNFKDNYRKDLKLGLSLIRNKNFGKAKVLVEKLIEKNPKNKQLQMLYGDCLIGMGELGLARNCFYDCLSEVKLRAKCYSKIAWTSEKLGEFNQALIYYKKALQIQSKKFQHLEQYG